MQICGQPRSAAHAVLDEYPRSVPVGGAAAQPPGVGPAQVEGDVAICSASVRKGLIADRAVVCKNWETKNRQEKKKHELLFHKMGCFREYAFTLPEMKII